jgi:hypothetical protein
MAGTPERSALADFAVLSPLPAAGVIDVFTVIFGVRVEVEAAGIS